MKKRTILFLLLIFLSFYVNNTVFSAENNVTITSKSVDLMKIIEIRWDTVVVHGDISFSDWVEIPYDLEIEWDLKIGSHVQLFWNIKVAWDVVLWNHVRVYKTLEWKNISAWNYLRANKIIAHNDLEFHGFAKIIWGLNIWWDFDSGSNMILEGNSKILWDVKLWTDVTISGIFYVYGSMNGNYDFLFRWDKFRIVWDFKTQQTSNLIGKLYLFAATWHRTLFWNRTVRFRYKFINTQFKGVMKKIDPILDYRLSKLDIDLIHNKLVTFEKKMSQQKKIIQQKFNSEKNEIIMNIEIKKLIFIQKEMFDYISPLIEQENWDITKWKLIQIQEKTSVKTFIYQYISGVDFDY